MYTLLVYYIKNLLKNNKTNVAWDNKSVTEFTLLN